MHDLNFFRNNLEAIREKLAARGFDLDIASFQELDLARRTALTESEQLKAQR
ncbi:MAG TPA: serine--tRNA ligase, partial [Bryobacteraceae bacterium]